MERVPTPKGVSPWITLGVISFAGLMLLLSSLTLAASLGAFNPAPPPPSPSPPYSSDNATPQCNNDCGNCGSNGGCTYSYGNGGAEHDGRAYVSNGVCDDGGTNAVNAYCDLGSDCADCGPRVATG